MAGMTMPVAAVINSGPKYGIRCATPENAAQAPAFSSPIARRAPHISRASSTLVTSSMNM